MDIDFLFFFFKSQTIQHSVILFAKKLSRYSEKIKLSAQAAECKRSLKLKIRVLNKHFDE